MQRYSGREVREDFPPLTAVHKDTVQKHQDPPLAACVPVLDRPSRQLQPRQRLTSAAHRETLQLGSWGTESVRRILAKPTLPPVVSSSRALILDRDG